MGNRQGIGFEVCINIVLVVLFALSIGHASAQCRSKYEHTRIRRCTRGCTSVNDLCSVFFVTLPVSQIIADWKQQNATDAVQKITRFAAMFGSVTHSHQPPVT